MCGLVQSWGCEKTSDWLKSCGLGITTSCPHPKVSFLDKVHKEQEVSINTSDESDGLKKSESPLPDTGFKRDGVVFLGAASILAHLIKQPLKQDIPKHKK